MSFESFNPEPGALEPVIERFLPAATGSESLNSLIKEKGVQADLFGNRVEWKYVLEPKMARAFREVAAQALRLEEFVPGRKRTLMHSIYFDSPDFVLYRRAALAQSNLKFRLRTYSTHGAAGSGDPNGFFECKIGELGKKYKLRASVPLLGVGALIQPAHLHPGMTGRLNLLPEQRFLKKALRVMQEYQMAARLTVSYVREAFVSEDGQVRVTFDEQYHAARIEQGDRSPLGTTLGRLDATIVEVKFVGDLPAWLSSVLLALGLPLGGISFSKFRQGVALTYPEVAINAAGGSGSPARSGFIA